MKDGLYKILFKGHVDFGGTEIGSFVVMDGKIKNRTGLAAEVLVDGPITGAVRFRIDRLNNGYNYVEWERPVRREPIHGQPPKDRNL